MVEVLRILTCIELFLHADFYCSHPLFFSCFSEHRNNFPSLGSLLAISVSDTALLTNCKSDELVRQEAIHSCCKNRWSSFLSILALSTVVGRSITTFYPDIGFHKYKLLFNQVFIPRMPSNSSEGIYILFCHEGNLTVNDNFLPNHFVPLVFGGKSKRVLEKKQFSGSSSFLQPILKCKRQNEFFFQSKIRSFLPSLKKKPEANLLTVSSAFSSGCHSFKVSLPSIAESSLAQNLSSSNSCIAESSLAPSVSLSSLETASKKSVASASDKLTNFFKTSVLPKFSKKKTLNVNICNNEAVNESVTNMPQTVSKYDVGTYYDKAEGLTREQLLDLIKNVSVPEKSYIFPKDVNNRSFRRVWLDDYSWLCYSPSNYGGYCLPCTLFSHKVPNKTNKATNLISTAQSHWSDSVSTFKRHQTKSVLHKDTTNILNSFLDTASGKIKPIDQMINLSYQKKIEGNRKFLAPIVDTVILCGRLALPLRGHRDDAKYHGEVGQYSVGQVGNFVELLNYRVRGGDEILGDHMRHAPKNATYISKTTQNDLIKCCGSVITDKIIKEVKKAKFFTILCDEASDSSNKEQMALVLRFVDEENNIREDFIRFIHCKDGLSGEKLAKVITTTIDNLSLDIKHCRGQGYDGAGAVAGHVNGCSAHILRLNKKAVYCHCFSHRLNLVICNSCTVREVRNMMDQIKDISYFFNLSQPRQQMLETAIKTHCPESRSTKLIDVCRTRWVERVVGLDHFEEMFIAIVQTFENMCNNLQRECNRDTQSKALSHLKLVTSYEFIVALVITRNVFDLTIDVTRVLQARNNDILDAIHLINTLKAKFSEIRCNIHFYHKKWYDNALELAKKVKVCESKPRICSRQTNRSNPPSEDTSQYFLRSISIPLVDHVVSGLASRFDTSITSYHGLVLVPSKLLHFKYAKTATPWKQQFHTFFKFYEDDMPNPYSIDAELELWEKYWVDYKGCHPNSVGQTLKCMPHGVFKNIEASLRILATLPVTSCECERSFSALRRLKNYSRSTMVEDRLNGLALLHIHQEIEPTVNEVIQKVCCGWS